MIGIIIKIVGEKIYPRIATFQSSRTSYIDVILLFSAYKMHISQAPFSFGLDSHKLASGQTGHSVTGMIYRRYLVIKRSNIGWIENTQQN